MPNPVSKIARNLKQLADIRVNDWDFMALMNTEIKDLELARNLRRLGSVKVMDGDFRTILPVLERTANYEVDILSYLRRAANLRVCEWEFGVTRTHEPETTAPIPASEAVIHPLIPRLEGFLRYMADQIADNPADARIKATQIAPYVIRFTLLLPKKDLNALIGRNGETAEAIRALVKASAADHGMQALLDIRTHEEETARLLKKPPTGNSGGRA